MRNSLDAQCKIWSETNLALWYTVICGFTVSFSLSYPLPLSLSLGNRLNGAGWSSERGFISCGPNKMRHETTGTDWELPWPRFWSVLCARLSLSLFHFPHPHTHRPCLKKKKKKLSINVARLSSQPPKNRWLTQLSAPLKMWLSLYTFAENSGCSKISDVGSV